MRINIILFVSLSLMLSSISCATMRKMDNPGVSALEQLPPSSVYAFRYRCRDMILCVNRLRTSGKESALAALGKYNQAHPMVREPLQDKKLMFVCRLLFVFPEGWRPLGISSAEPEINQDAAGQFPLFPIAISEGVPFLLIEGHHIEGVVSENGATDIRQCANLSIVGFNLPTTGYKGAAEKLIQSKAFKNLYVDPSDRERMAQEILNQAE